MHFHVWIISCTPDSADTLRDTLGGPHGNTSTPFEWWMSAGPTLNQKPPVPLSRFNCVIIVVDRASLNSEEFRHAVRLPLATAVDRDDLPIFPWLRDGLTVDELRRLAEQGNALAVSLVENIQLDSSFESIETLTEALQVYFTTQYRLLRDANTFRRLSLTFNQVCGRFAAWISLLVVLVAFALGALLEITGSTDFSGGRLLVQILEILVIAALVILYFRGERLLAFSMYGSQIKRGYSLFELEIIAVPATLLAIMVWTAPVAMKSSTETIVAGAGFGLMLVTLARMGQQARVQAIPFSSIPELIATGRMLGYLYGLMPSAFINTGARMFARPDKRVFISYSRSSTWSSAVANEVAAALRELGAIVFLDQPSLQPGTSWKRQLRAAIVDSDRFVAILDSNAARREWIAAEFCTAYLSKMVTRMPEIFVICPSDMEFSEADTPENALFHELMIRPSGLIPQWMWVLVTAYDPKTIRDVCGSIVNYRLSGFLGFQADRILGLVLACIVPLCGVVEGLGVFLGVPVIIGLLLKPQFLVDHSSLVLPIAFASAFQGGFGLRCSVFVLAEDPKRAEYGRGPVVLELFAGVLFFGIAALCLPLLSAVQIILLFLAVYWGIGCGSYYATFTRFWKQRHLDSEGKL